MIITDPEILSKPCVPLNIKDMPDIIGKLENELAISGGIGLAANQIGYNVRACVVSIPYKDGETIRYNRLFLANPVIIEAHAPIISLEEECLSFKGSRVKTVRWGEVVVKQDKWAEDAPETMIFSSLTPSITGNTGYSVIETSCVQHELSHLFGLTIFDFKAYKVERNEPCPLHKDKKNKKCCNISHFNENLFSIIGK